MNGGAIMMLGVGTSIFTAGFVLPQAIMLVVGFFLLLGAGILETASQE